MLYWNRPTWIERTGAEERKEERLTTSTPLLIFSRYQTHLGVCVCVCVAFCLFLLSLFTFAPHGYDRVGTGNRSRAVLIQVVDEGYYRIKCLFDLRLRCGFEAGLSIVIPFLACPLPILRSGMEASSWRPDRRLSSSTHPPFPASFSASRSEALTLSLSVSSDHCLPLLSPHGLPTSSSFF